MVDGFEALAGFATVLVFVIMASLLAAVIFAITSRHREPEQDAYQPREKPLEFPMRLASRPMASDPVDADGVAVCVSAFEPDELANEIEAECSAGVTSSMVDPSPEMLWAPVQIDDGPELWAGPADTSLCSPVESSVDTPAMDRVESSLDTESYTASVDAACFDSNVGQ